MAPANKRLVIAFLISWLLSMSAYTIKLDVGPSTRSKEFRLFQTAPDHQ